MVFPRLILVALLPLFWIHLVKGVAVDETFVLKTVMNAEVRPMLESKDVCVINRPIEVDERFLCDEIGEYRFRDSRVYLDGSKTWNVFHHSAHYVVPGSREKGAAIWHQWLEPAREIEFSSRYSKGWVGISGYVNSWRLAEVGIVHTNLYRLISLNRRVDNDELFRADGPEALERCGQSDTLPTAACW